MQSHAADTLLTPEHVLFFLEFRLLGWSMQSAPHSASKFTSSLCAMTAEEQPALMLRLP